MQHNVTILLIKKRGILPVIYVAILRIVQSGRFTWNACWLLYV